MQILSFVRIPNHPIDHGKNSCESN